MKVQLCVCVCVCVCVCGLKVWMRRRKESLVFPSCYEIYGAVDASWSSPRKLREQDAKLLFIRTDNLPKPLSIRTTLPALFQRPAVQPRSSGYLPTVRETR